jgi:hypothetical protein
MGDTTPTGNTADTEIPEAPTDILGDTGMGIPEIEGKGIFAEDVGRAATATTTNPIATGIETATSGWQGIAAMGIIVGSSTPKAPTKTLPRRNTATWGKKIITGQHKHPKTWTTSAPQSERPFRPTWLSTGCGFKMQSTDCLQEDPSCTLTALPNNPRGSKILQNPQTRASHFLPRCGERKGTNPPTR